MLDTLDLTCWSDEQINQLEDTLLIQMEKIPGFFDDDTKCPELNVSSVPEGIDINALKVAYQARWREIKTNLLEEPMPDEIPQQYLWGGEDSSGPFAWRIEQLPARLKLKANSCYLIMLRHVSDVYHAQVATPPDYQKFKPGAQDFMSKVARLIGKFYFRQNLLEQALTKPLTPENLTKIDHAFDNLKAAYEAILVDVDYPALTQPYSESINKFACQFANQQSCEGHYQAAIEVYRTVPMGCESYLQARNGAFMAAYHIGLEAKLDESDAITQALPWLITQEGQFIDKTGANDDDMTATVDQFLLTSCKIGSDVDASVPLNDTQRMTIVKYHVLKQAGQQSRSHPGFWQPVDVLPELDSIDQINRSCSAIDRAFVMVEKKFPGESATTLLGNLDTHAEAQALQSAMNQIT